MNRSVSVVTVAEWLAPVAAPEKKARKSKSTKQVCNPIFALCAEQTDDPWWKEKFMNAALGKMPSKLFSVKEDRLIYSKRNFSKAAVIEIPAAPYEAFHACKEFFMTHAHLISPRDQAAVLEDQRRREERETLKEPKRWGDFSAKMRTVLLNYYVERMGGILALSAAEKRDLRFRIDISLMLGALTKENIVVEDSRIVKIERLFFDTDARVFFVEGEGQPKSRSAPKKKAKKSGPGFVRKGVVDFENSWAAYCAYLERKEQEALRIASRSASVRQWRADALSGEGEDAPESEPFSSGTDRDGSETEFTE